MEGKSRSQKSPNFRPPKKSKYFPSEIYKPSQNGKTYDWNKENLSNIN